MKRGPFALGAVAIALLGVGFYLQIGQNERNLERAAAIAAGPPDVVEFDQYDAGRDMTGQREVVVRGQPVLENAYRLIFSES